MRPLLLLLLVVLLPLTLLVRRGARAGCSSATTPPPRSASGWSGRGCCLIVFGVALAAIATAAAGPIGFVAFVSGPIARRLTHGTGIALIPAGAGRGGRRAGRRLRRPAPARRCQLPVGVLTAARRRPVPALPAGQLQPRRKRGLIVPRHTLQAPPSSASATATG